MFFFLSSTSPSVLWTTASCFFISGVTPVPASRTSTVLDARLVVVSLALLALAALGALGLAGLVGLLLLELAGRDLVRLLDGLVADQLGHLEHVHVVVDEGQRRERLQVVAVEGEHGAQVADGLLHVLLLLFRARVALVAQDLRQVVARLDGVQRVDLDGAREERLGLARVAVLPGDVAEVRDRGAVLEALPDLDGVVLVAALGEHGALVEARLDEGGVLVGGALEGARDAAALGARQAARLLGRGVLLRRLVEVGARVGADLPLGLLRDDLLGVRLALAGNEAVLFLGGGVVGRRELRRAAGREAQGQAEAQGQKRRSEAATGGSGHASVVLHGVGPHVRHLPLLLVETDSASSETTGVGDIVVET